MNELRTGRVFSILVLSLALLGAAYQMARATPSALVEADNPNLWIWVYSPSACTQFPNNPTGDSLENVVKNTLPMEWEPSWAEHAVKAGAVLVRTVAWEHWYNPQWTGWYNFTSQNVDKGQSQDPLCAGRMNYVVGASANYGNSGYGTNSATDNTYGLYIPSGDSVRNINWGDVVQNRTNDCAGQGDNFYNCVVYAYNSDTSYRPAPLALDSSKAFKQPILDAHVRNGGGAAVGWAFNNGGSEWVYTWGSGLIQDFKGESGQNGALMQRSGSSTAYWIHGSIWDW